MEVSYFKSVMDKRLLDSLWNHYWVNTLSSSSLITNAEYTTGNFVCWIFFLEYWLNYKNAVNSQCSKSYNIIVFVSTQKRAPKNNEINCSVKRLLRHWGPRHWGPRKKLHWGPKLYSGDLKSDHLKTRHFEGLISNGPVFKWLGYRAAVSPQAL